MGVDHERRLGPRAARAQETRRRIVDAAYRLFTVDGYLPTTMSAIAREAGVAVQTLYLSFGSKASILSAALDTAIVGDDAPVPLMERPWFQEVCAEPEGRRAVTLVCQEVVQLFHRVAPLHLAIRAATGDADVRRLLADDQRNRFAATRQCVAILASKRGFDAELGEERATDVVYGLLSEAVYLLFCVDRQWPEDDWTAWVASTLADQLFPPPTGS